MSSSSMVKEEPQSPVQDPGSNLLNDLFAPTATSDAIANLNFNVKEEPMEHINDNVNVNTNPIIRTVYSRHRYIITYLILKVLK